jgi:hypothetical protein
MFIASAPGVPSTLGFTKTPSRTKDDLQFKVL